MILLLILCLAVLRSSLRDTKPITGTVNGRKARLRPMRNFDVGKLGLLTTLGKLCGGLIAQKISESYPFGNIAQIQEGEAKENAGHAGLD